MNTVNSENTKPAVQIPSNNRDENMWAMFCHLSTFTILLIPSFGNIIAPLIIWLIKKDEFPFVNDQGKEALNFQITMTIFFIAAAIFSLFVIGIPILIALFFFVPIVTIIAAIKANEGQMYRYPLTIRFIS